MFDQHADDIEFVNARVVGRVVDVQRDELKDLIPVRVIAAWSVFLKGRFQLIRLLAQASSDNEVAGARRDRRVDDDHIFFVEVRLHRGARHLQCKALVRQLFVDPDEVPVVEGGLARLDLADSRRRSCLNVRKDRDPLHVASHRLDIRLSQRGVFFLGIASSANQPVQRKREVSANSGRGIGSDSSTNTIHPAIH